MNYELGLPERIRFGRFCLMPRRRGLLCDGQPVRLGDRAFDVLLALIEAHGDVVSKDALMARVWPDQVIEENNLEVQVSALRTAFGEERALIRTVYRRGYQFTGQLGFPAEDAQEKASADAIPATNLPQPLSELIGRDDDLHEILRLAAAQRLVTLTGTGGIGKTRLALAAAHRLPRFDDGVWLVDLAPLSDPHLVPATVAAAVGVRFVVGAVTPQRVANALRGKELLVLLDNCEHVIDAAAITVDALLHANPAMRIIATSREPLRVEGEHVYPVPPLAVPATDTDDSTNPLEYGAVQLFVERARAAELRFAPDRRTAVTIATICRRLDGIPLAIEMAAARVATLGIQELAVRLGDRLALLTSGRRTALPRHRTLRATLDWSYELLPKGEQRLLCRLAVFPSGFTLDAAVAVMGEVADPPAVTCGIGNLVNKSLVTLEQSTTRGRWRLTEMTRVYALEKLEETDRVVDVARLHAEFYLALFAPFSSEDRLRAAIDGLHDYNEDLANLRAALNWAFSPKGNTALGVALAATATDFWIAASQVEEVSEWASKALALIGDASGSRHEMTLQCNLGVALMYTRGMITPSRSALTRALALAQELGDVDYQQRSVRALWLFSARAAASNDALAFARQYEELARDRDEQSRAVADLMVGMSQTYLAAHGEASARLQRAIDRYPLDRGNRDLYRFDAEIGVSLAVNLLSRGSVEVASRMATGAIEAARGTTEAVLLCIVLAWVSGIIFLSLGELEAADRYAEELIGQADKHGLRPFHAIGLCVRASVAAKRGDPESGLDPLRRGLAEMQEAGYLQFHSFFRTELATALGAVGRVDDSLVEIDGAMRFAEENNCQWLVPEIWRIKGELLAAQPSENPATVADLIHRSMDLARDQGALYWELCAATSLAEFMRRQNKRAEARAVLAPVYGRFTEGFAALKLKQAKDLLDQLP
jgi:non-specific serine/threonine protein kinase